MKFLLLILSLIFSWIFYLFYIKEKWESIFFGKITNTYTVDTLFISPGLISLLFLIIWIIFFILFTELKKNNSLDKKEFFSLIKSNLFNLIFLLIIPILIQSIFNYLKLNYYYLSIIYFIFSLLLYYIVINFKIIKNNKEYRIIIKYLSLIYIYLSTIFWIIYTYSKIDYLIYFILFYSIIFNFIIHFKYKNYISLLFSIFLIFIIIFKLMPLS